MEKYRIISQVPECNKFRTDVIPIEDFYERIGCEAFIVSLAVKTLLSDKHIQILANNVDFIRDYMQDNHIISLVVDEDEINQAITVKLTYNLEINP